MTIFLINIQSYSYLLHSNFSNDSNGFLYFFMNGRLGILYRCGNTVYYNAADGVNLAKFFISRLHQAKAAVPSGAETKPILTVPRTSKSIQSGNWDLSSVETGKLLVTNEFTRQELTIKEDFVLLGSHRLGNEHEFIIYDMQNTITFFNFT